MAYSLFNVYGVEMEYMIVDRSTLAVKPIADELLRSMAGDWVSDVENGTIDWSNELVNHVVEIKTHRPEPSLLGLEKPFHANVQQINQQLQAFDAMLLPTGAHPLMDPFTETRLWPHEHKEIYNLYNRIFDCRGHGWSNLQSTHINLPFSGDAEFRQLHAAIRLLLPIIPALSASTPILDGKDSGFRDMRLETYRFNQKRIPIIAGSVIPEPVFSQQAYHEHIFHPIRTAIAPFDTENILDQHFLNSRGAIARFDRGAIEIRIIDIQECPLADISILLLISSCLQKLVSQDWADTEAQSRWGEQELAEIFLDVIRDGEDTPIRNKAYLALLACQDPSLTAGELWQHLFERLSPALPEPYAGTIGQILKEGTLSSRILRRLRGDVSPPAIREQYFLLSQCLQENRLYV
ncbi:carboxylate-amine ligase [Cesiribacter andamanensis]|uniref:Carboxylate-amine ligase n=1 Tax=Cesiribacter andamanensis AMV16 TaxID=1279009 RepID=M7P1G7_9BACT|nr:glutamate-cysteine ligase family protein [Cesiribacter andamanensis]EMR04459.1 carboxylate-amine ligase [Cesiribacter andamanensis AMV16]